MSNFFVYASIYLCKTHMAHKEDLLIHQCCKIPPLDASSAHVSNSPKGASSCQDQACKATAASLLRRQVYLQNKDESCHAAVIKMKDTWGIDKQAQLGKRGAPRIQTGR